MLPDTNFGPYRLIESIGKGGMGEVWKAEDTRLGRTVAIKVLPAAVTSDPEAIARLKREARTAAQLYHPNIATIHSIEQDGDRIFIVMELVAGDPLTHVIRAQRMSEAEICRIGRGVADALSEAHAHGIVHRDIKPDNIIVSGNRVKVLDFGIAKQVGAVTTSGDSPTAFVTQQGMILGTVHYMSPEQALGKTLDARTDIFSLGVVLYQAATGRLPFAGETVTETMTQIIRDEPEDAARINPGLSPGLNAIIQRCMRKKPEDRYQSAQELVAALDQQMGRAGTAPYLPAVAPVATPASTTTSAKTLDQPALSGSLLQTVKEPAVQPKRGAAPLLIALIVLLSLGAVGWFALGRNHTTAPVPAATSTQPSQTPSSTSVNVTAEPASSSTAATTTEDSADATTTMTSTDGTEESESPVKGTITHASTAADSSSGDEAQANDAGEPSAGITTGHDPDARYAEGVDQLVAGDGNAARKSFQEVIASDPHHAPAHFRLGEIALFRHNFGGAAAELERALGDAGRLDARERHLTRLCLAIARQNRIEAKTVARETWKHWPGDPDLLRIWRQFGQGEELESGRTFRQRRRGF